VPLIVEVNAPLAQERAQGAGLALLGLARFSERFVWRTADIILPVTEALGGHVRAAGVAKSRVQVVMNGINPEHFPRSLTGDDVRAKYGLGNKIVIGFTGFFRDWHGLPDVIDVIHPLINRYDIHFLVVGDGPARKALVEHARAHGLSDRMTITGVVERSEIPGHVACFDIALQPRATNYASPLKLFEYMALGCAILAPDQANLREVLSNDVNALLFSPEDPCSFRANLQRLIASRDLRKRLGAAAFQTIHDRDLTWAGNARRVEKALQELSLRAQMPS